MIKKNEKICLFGNSSSFGGAEIYLLSLAKGYSLKGFKVSIISDSNEYLNLLSSRLNSLIALKRSISFVFLPNIIETYLFFRNNKSSIFHFNMQNTVSCKKGLLAAYFANIKKCFITIHVVKRPRKWIFSYFFLNFLVRCIAIKFICVSHKSLNQLKNNFYLPLSKLAVVHNGVSDDYNFSNVKFTSFPNDKGIKSLGTVSRLEEGKGLEFLLFAFGRILKKYPHLRLTIVGDGSLLKNLTDICLDLGIIKNVDFIGYVDKPLDYLLKMDIVIFPSLDETFGLSIAESISLGKPVIFTKESGISELLESFRSCIIINAGFEDEIYNAIDLLIGHTDLRNRISEGALNCKEIFSVDKMLKSTLAMYKSELAKKKRQLI